MNKLPKIHFINRIDQNNAGDWYCSPLLYYYDYFKKYSLIRHDVDYIDFNIIEKDDVVIIGGGGMLYVTYSFQEAINRLLTCCDTVIAWSVGFNTHNERWFQGDQFPEINFDRFSLIRIRDYNHPSKLEYLPCPSVLAFDRPQKGTCKRKFGVIEHKDLPIQNLCFTDRIKNSSSLSEIQEYIQSSEAIITNSYHCAYWTQLLGTKCIVVNRFSTKFDFFEHRPEFVDTVGKSEHELKKEFGEAFDRALVYPDFYDEAVSLNHSFFEKVKNIIESKEIPANKEFEEWYNLTVLQLWNRQVQAEKIRSEVFELHEDVYGRLKKNDDRIEKLLADNERMRQELEWIRLPWIKKMWRRLKRRCMDTENR